MLAEPIRPDREGILRVPSTPGLGVVLDDVAVKRFAA
jgi:L-alanine-DL-glutamate epimerase-like enolase superfamily enzyme